ncbi:MAG: hypothetical protein JXR37_27465 [Kiritimatiellae bacterium]|nr:hypothetical protein [Kiritimatiellia bacterium]
MKEDTVSGYDWLVHFWKHCVPVEPQRTWDLVVLIDGDLALRDGFAYALLRDCLSTRRDVAHRFVRAWSSRPTHSDLEVPAKADTNILFLGRPKPSSSCPRYNKAVGELEGKAFGRFSDPTTGGAGREIQYGKTVFHRHAIEEPEEGRYRRCDRDYGLLFLRHTLERKPEEKSGPRLVAIGGLGALGTLGLAQILTTPEKRCKLAQQAAEVLELQQHHRWARHVEMCVRVQVSGETALDRILNALAEGDADAFDFQVEAIAVENEDGTADIRIRKERDAVYEIRLRRIDGRNQVRVVPGGSWSDLPPKRFELLELLNDAREMPAHELCRRLGYMGQGDKGEPNQKTLTRLSKLIHDLNKSLENACGEKRIRPVRFDKPKKVYRLRL